MKSATGAAALAGMKGDAAPLTVADAPESGLPMILSPHSNRSADAAKESLLSLVDEFLTHTQP